MRVHMTRHRRRHPEPCNDPTQAVVCDVNRKPPFRFAFGRQAGRVSCRCRAREPRTPSETTAAPLAQLAEQLTLNQWVSGSSPEGCTVMKARFAKANRAFCFPRNPHEASAARDTAWAAVPWPPDDGVFPARPLSRKARSTRSL